MSCSRTVFILAHSIFYGPESVRLSTTRWYCIEMAEQIGLVFGAEVTLG